MRYLQFMKAIASITPRSLTIGEYDFVGVSTAGVGTSITIPKLKVCFDTAQGLPHAFNMKHFLVTHAHMDHAGGIPYILSQKSMTGQSPGVFYMPPYMIQPLTQILKTWSSIEGYDCPFKFQEVVYDKEYPINSDYFFKIFKTHHRIASNGYTLFQRHKKLKLEYAHLGREQLINLRKKGTEINAITALPKISFTGDSKIEFLDTCPWLTDSEILFMEVTFAGENRTIDQARKWGHIHLDELVPRLETLNCKKIVLIHPSGRYSPKVFQQLVDESVPAKHRARIVLFPRP